MAEIIAAIAGPALIALIVYRYRSVITYDLATLTEQFGMEENVPIKDSNHPQTRITLERLEIKNRGWKNLQRVKLHLEHTPALFNSGVTKTSTIGKRAVKVQNDGDDLLIEIEELPRGESVTIELAHFGHGGWGQFRDLKGASSSYKVARRSHWEANRQGILAGIFIGGLVVAMQIAVSIASG